MEKNQLLYVLETARTENITRAAERLHITQPSLSNQIIRLEEELGIRLFERRRKRVVVTEAGQAFCVRAAQILKDFDELEDLMHNYAHRKVGSIRVGILPIMIPLGLLDAVDSFAKDNPHVKLAITETASNTLLQMIRDNQLDAAIVTLPASWSDEHIQRHMMSDDDICAVIHTENPLAKKPELTMKDLAGQKLIMNTGNYSLQQQILTNLDSSGTPYHIAIRCDQIETSLALAGRNYGISFASRNTARFYDLPNTAVIPITDLPSRGIYAVHIKDPEYYPVLRNFLRHILKNTEQADD